MTIIDAGGSTGYHGLSTAVGTIPQVNMGRGELSNLELLSDLPHFQKRYIIKNTVVGEPLAVQTLAVFFNFSRNL